VKDLYKEKYKSLRKEVEENIRLVLMSIILPTQEDHGLKPTQANSWWDSI
jgi:hypothetical protein